MTKIPNIYFNGILTESKNLEQGSKRKPPKSVGERKHIFKDFSWNFRKFHGDETTFFSLKNPKQPIWQATIALYASIECEMIANVKSELSEADKFCILVVLTDKQALVKSYTRKFIISSDDITLHGAQPTKPKYFSLSQKIGLENIKAWGVWRCEVTTDRPYIPDLKKVNSLKVL